MVTVAGSGVDPTYSNIIEIDLDTVIIIITLLETNIAATGSLSKRKTSIPALSFKEGTLPETNIAPENEWLEDEMPFGMAYFQGLC